MNKQLLTALSLAAISTFSFGLPKIYGEIDVSLDYLPENNRAGVDDSDVVDVSSNSSHIGIKGEESLTNNIDILYLAEWTINADGDGSDLAQRNRFIGLKHSKFGTIKAGKNDTPVKQLSSAVDTFNNYAANKADIAGIFTGENRIDNVVIYESPTIALPKGKLNINALLASGESTGIATSSGGSKAAGSGVGDAWSASIVYNNPLLLLGLGYDKNIPSNFAGRGTRNASSPEISGGSTFAAANTFRATGRLKLKSGLTIKALYQTSEVEEELGNAAAAVNIDTSDGWLLGAEYNFPQAQKWTVKAQYSANSTSYVNGDADYDASQIMAGVDYAFNKSARVYGYAGYLTLEQGSLEDKQPLVGAGLEYKF